MGRTLAKKGRRALLVVDEDLKRNLKFGLNTVGEPGMIKTIFSSEDL
jgi:hypothetical protein